MPVILALWEAEVDHLKSGVQDQPDKHGETPSLLKNNNKIKKNKKLFLLSSAILQTQEFVSHRLL